MCIYDMKAEIKFFGERKGTSGMGELERENMRVNMANA